MLFRYCFYIINEKLFWCLYGNEGLCVYVVVIVEKCNLDYKKNIIYFEMIVNFIVLRIINDNNVLVFFGIIKI